MMESNIFDNHKLSNKLMNKPKREIKKVPISLLGPGSYFGAEEVLNQCLFRDSTAVCNSAEVDLLILDKDDYILLMF